MLSGALAVAVSVGSMSDGVGVELVDGVVLPVDEELPQLLAERVLAAHCVGDRVARDTVDETEELGEWVCERVARAVTEPDLDPETVADDVSCVETLGLLVERKEPVNDTVADGDLEDVADSDSE